ncbi:MAG TPA: nucleotidyltransferase family protein [Nocardioidaceae bacterium]|jgi:hypothetical protein|nr:nucleotidyltransferase family protein [Nocardioidaceae bacterium]
MSESDALREALKRVAVGLKTTGLPFALAGGYAAWALGGPEPNHDVDFLVAPGDVDQVKKALVDQGLQVVQPPEDWLFKVSCDGVTVDVLHRGSGRELSDTLAATRRLEVLSVEMPVLAPTDVLVHKLLALDEHYCDLSSVISVARALREQVDWATVRACTAGSAFAEAVLFLLERLDIIATAR